jgi:hypothetical protein
LARSKQRLRASCEGFFHRSSIEHDQKLLSDSVSMSLKSGEEAQGSERKVAQAGGFLAHSRTAESELFVGLPGAAFHRDRVFTVPQAT